MAELRKYGWGEAHRPEPAFPTLRVYVWELPVRVSHWFIFLPVVVLSFTGYYIHNPFIVAKSTTTFLMATMRFIHLVAGFVFISAFLLRLYWFFKGNSWANWRAFIPIHRRQWRGMGGMVAYYSFLRKDLSHHVGHNALAAMTYLLMFTLMLIEIITGLTLYTQSAREVGTGLAIRLGAGRDRYPAHPAGSLLHHVCLLRVCDSPRLQRSARVLGRTEWTDREHLHRLQVRSEGRTGRRRSRTE